MSQTKNKIKKGIKVLTHKEAEIISGTVVSIDESNYTIQVLATNEDNAIEGVMLSAVVNNDNGYILYPAVNSDVIIACVDGPGEYMLIKASVITKAVIKINDQVFTLDGTKYGLVKGSESLGKIMSDLMDKMLAMTFTNGAGTTGSTNNNTDLTQIKNRITNFLTI